MTPEAEDPEVIRLQYIATLCAYIVLTGAKLGVGHTVGRKAKALRQKLNGDSIQWCHRRVESFCSTNGYDPDWYRRLI